jgi:aspartyl protease family protein
MNHQDMRPDWVNAPARERSYVLPAFLAMLLIAGGGTFGYFYFSAPKTEYAISTAAFMRLDTKGRELVQHLGEEPCNRDVALDLSNQLKNAAEYAATIKLIHNFEKRCGPHEDMLFPLLTAQQGSSDLAGAEETTSRMLALHPNGNNAYFNRARIRSARGNLSGAYEDYRKAIYIYSDPREVNYTAFSGMAETAAKLGRPCEAMQLVSDYFALSDESERTANRLAVMRDYQKEGACSSPFSNGSVRMSYQRKLGAILLPVKLNGVEGKFIVDTGASRTVVTRAFAARADIKGSDKDGIIAYTANGAVWSMGGRAKSLSLGSATTRDVMIYIETKKGLPPGIDGLLGLSFLGNFKVTISNGMLELQPLS